MKALILNSSPGHRMGALAAEHPAIAPGSIYARRLDAVSAVCAKIRGDRRET